jgi:pimeloyl-ACP methyl ester carboxylesterase
VFSSPVTVTIKYSQEYLDDFGIADPSDLRIVHKPEGAAPDILPTLTQDLGQRTLSGQVSSFSIFLALLPYHVPLFQQERSFVTVKSKTNFWSSNKNNLLLIHGITGDESTFSTLDDLIGGLDEAYDNIMLYVYPSGYPIAGNGDFLRDYIRQNTSSGFKTDIIAHSMGGLVARWALERSGGLPGKVDHLITLGTPHLGAPEQKWISGFFPLAVTWLAYVIPGLADLADTPTSFGPQLSSPFQPAPSVKYFFLAGNALLSSDGIVPVTSATNGGNAGSGETQVFPLTGSALTGSVTHSGLHTDSINNGVRDQIEFWIGAGFQITGVVKGSVLGDTIEGAGITIVGTTTYGAAINMPSPAGPPITIPDATTDGSGKYSFPQPEWTSVFLPSFPPLVRGNYTISVSTPSRPFTPQSVNIIFSPSDKVGYKKTADFQEEELTISPSNVSMLSLGSGNPQDWPRTQFSVSGGMPPYTWGFINGTTAGWPDYGAGFPPPGNPVHGSPGGVVDEQTGFCISQRNAGTGTLIVTDALGRTGRTTVTTSTTDVASWTPDLNPTMSGGAQIQYSEAGCWRITAGPGQYQLTLTNTGSSPTQPGTDVAFWPSIGAQWTVLSGNPALSIPPGGNAVFQLQRTQ